VSPSSDERDCLLISKVIRRFGLRKQERFIVLTERALTFFPRSLACKHRSWSSSSPVKNKDATRRVKTPLFMGENGDSSPKGAERSGFRPLGPAGRNNPPQGAFALTRHGNTCHPSRKLRLMTPKTLPLSQYTPDPLDEAVPLDEIASDALPRTEPEIVTAEDDDEGGADPLNPRTGKIYENKDPGVAIPAADRKGGTSQD
jgi:hypothetical protein